MSEYENTFSETEEDSKPSGRRKKDKQPKPPKAPKQKTGAGKVIFIAVIIALVVGALSGAAGAFFSVYFIDGYRGRVVYGPEEAEAEDAGETEAEVEAEPNDFFSGAGGTFYSGVNNSGSVTLVDVSDLVDRILPSVVAVTSTTVYNNYNMYGYGWFFGNGNGNSGTYEATSAGSGVIYRETDNEVLIVTNYHVVSNADSLTVTFLDDAENEAANVTAHVKGLDQSNDLAIIAVEKSDMDPAILAAISVANTATTDDIDVGEGVVAIGNALAYGQSVTTGIVSAKGRSITTDVAAMEDLIQTDAAINSGNSGGGLFDTQGRLIGINVAKPSGNSRTATIDGVGYAIPVYLHLDTLNQLSEQGTLIPVADEEVGYLGIQNYSTVDSATAQTYGIPNGVFVAQVVAGSPAEQAGMQNRDVITSFDGRTIRTTEDLANTIQYYAAGTEVVIKVQRQNGNSYEEVELTIVLGRRPQSADQNS